MEAMILREHHVFCEREIHQNPVSSGRVELCAPVPGGIIRGAGLSGNAETGLSFEMVISTLGTSYFTQIWET